MNLKKELRLQTLLVSFVVSLMIIAILSIIQNFTPLQNSLGKELLQINQEVTQTANAVTSVVTYFRGLDTLGEVTILFLAIFGISLTLEKNISKENNNIKITDSNYELLRELLNYASSMSIKMEEQKISSLLLNVENKLKEDSDPFNNLPF